MGLFGGGKNSFWSKPFGTGSGSVSKEIVDPVLGDARKYTDMVGQAATGSHAQNVQDIFGGDKVQGSTKSLSIGQIRGFMEEGEQKGETLTGSTMKEVGEGRGEVRDRLKETLAGNSAGANALRQDQADQQKKLRAQQAVAGQGQMNAGQQQALQRQAARDTAKFISNEKRQTLSDLSKEWRGAGGDIMRSSGQYGSVLVGAQPAAVPKQSNGLLSNLFGGLF